MNVGTLEVVNGSNGVGVNSCCDDDLEETRRHMRRFVDEIDQNYSLVEISGGDWEIYVEYRAALGQPVSERDLLRKEYPELYPEEIDFLLSPPDDSEIPF